MCKAETGETNKAWAHTHIFTAEKLLILPSQSYYVLEE